MIDVRYERGVHLPAEGLWLDPGGPRDLAFVSHAHSDHTGRHREAILTDATSQLMRERLGKPTGSEHVLPFGKRMAMENFEIELLPAGHVLGSAQCFVESAAGSLLYTGDFKLRPGLSCEPAATRHAETLVMETTFGLPHYIFPPTEEVLRDAVEFCVATRKAGATPVLLAYSLGKAQEILAALTAAGLPVLLHKAAWRMTLIYESLGMKFPGAAEYEDGTVRDHVVICPPGAGMLEKIPNRRVAALTGWALDPRTIYRMKVDAAFPLSDHAGYDDLLRFVELVNPKRVFTMHGFAREFARDLRARGVEAWTLSGVDQLELSLG
ncbi:MAG: MBL fold metallo-hydrolase RNA specificity domain-containing protein [Chthoniobacterales bacterium]